MKNMIVVNCMCRALEHIIRIWKDEEYDDFIFETGLNVNYNIFGRICLACKYVFFPQYFCGWQDTVVNRKEANRIIKFLKEKDH